MAKEQEEVTKKINKQFWTTQKLEELGFELLDWLKVKDNYLLAEFFNDKEILEEWVEDWSAKKTVNTSKQFKKCYQLALQIQKVKLMKMLVDKGNATAGVSMLVKNILGWNDSVEVQNTITDTSPEALDKIIRAKFPMYKKNFNSEKAVVGVSDKGKLVTDIITDDKYSSRLQ